MMRWILLCFLFLHCLYIYNSIALFILNEEWCNEEKGKMLQIKISYFSLLIGQSTILTTIFTYLNFPTLFVAKCSNT